VESDIMTAAAADLAAEPGGMFSAMLRLPGSCG